MMVPSLGTGPPEAARWVSLAGGSVAGAYPRAVVLGVGHMLRTCVLRGAARARVLPQGQVDHEVAGGGAVPVLLAGRRVDDVAGAGLDDLAAAGLDQGDALDDVEGLAQAARWEPSSMSRAGRRRGPRPAWQLIRFSFTNEPSVS